MATAPVFSDLQAINPSAIIELFELELVTAIHGSNTTYRFHSGSSLNANGEIVWKGNSYYRFPIEADGFAYQRGQIRSVQTSNHRLPLLQMLMLKLLHT